MKKHFLLFIAALCATVAVNAETITLEPGENKIKGLIDAGTLADGDVIELQTGTYTEWKSLTFTTKVTIKAAEGATPIVQPNVIKIKNDFEANGITFINLSKDNYLLRTGADVAGTIAIKNCNLELNAEVTNPVPYIYLSSNTIGNLVIDSCTFAPNAKTDGAIVYGLTTVNNFTMTNSTAVACGGTDLAVYMTGLTTATVDHCTFYNCGARVLYLKGDAMTSCAVSNCIVANAALVDQYCVATYAGTVDNVLYYNTKAPHSSDATVNGCINADPLFADPANGDFNFSIFSPLCFAATDGKHIGDPRWEAQSGAGIDLPTDATPVVLDKGNVGATSADMSYYGESGEYFDFGPNDSSNDTLRWAKWLVNIKKCAYSVSAELTSENSYKLVLDVIDPSTGAVVLTSDTAKNSPSFKTIDFSGLEEKSYILRLKNRQGWSKVKVKSVTFTYAGGAVVEVPGTLLATDAILTSGAIIKEDGYIYYSSTSVDNARWNIHASAAIGAKVSMDVKVASGHRFYVYVYDTNNQLIATAKEKLWNELEGVQDLGNVSFPAAGNYYVVVADSSGGSQATFKDLTFTAAGGEVVDAGLLPNEEVVLVGSVTRDENNNIKSSGEKTVPTDEYFYWNVNFPKEGYYDISLNVAARDEQGTSSGHIYKVFIDEEEQACTQEGYSELAGDCELTESAVFISTAGVHKIKIVNAQEWSSAMLHSVTLTYVGLIITDDSDIDFSDYAGRTVNVQLIRTFKANMYNPLCLPFAVSDELFQQIFKSPKSFTLGEASLENQKLFVKLAENYGIYQGTPVMVKPSEDVVNPIFENVEIKTANPSSTTKGPLCLRGSFARHELENKENILLVGANNTLFFPSDEHPYIKSMRAYFILKDVEPSQMPRFAAFVEPGNAPTEMIIVGGEAERQKGHRKVLVDGQIRIQHEGKCYSILGLER